MKFPIILLASTLVAGVPLLCPVAARAQVAAKIKAKPTLIGAPALLAKLPALTVTERQQMMMDQPENRVFFGAEIMGFDETDNKMVPDAARLEAWKAVARRYHKAGGAPTAREWLGLEARRAAILTPASKPLTDEERNAPGFDGEAEMKARRADSMPTPGFASAVDILPAPAQWPALLQGARKIYRDAPDAHNAAVYYFSARLNADNAEQVEALRALYRVWAPQFRADMSVKVEGDEYGGRGARRVSLERDKSLAELLLSSPDVAQQVQGLRWQLQLGELLGGAMIVQMPDLVSDWGMGRARAFLPEVLSSKARLQWYNAGVTRALAAEMWLANPALQKQPQWELSWANEPLNVPFALAMIEKFAPKKAKPDVSDDDMNELDGYEDSYNYRAALSGVLQTLIKRDEFARADALMARWNRQGWVNPELSFYLYDNDATSTQQAARLDWMEATMTRYPRLDWWSAYRDLALTSGQGQRALKFVSARLPHRGSVPNEGAIRDALAKLYLDDGQIETGGTILASRVEIATYKGSDASNRAENIASLLRLTRVAPNLKWLQIARAGAQKLAGEPINQGNADEQLRQIADIALQLHEQKQSVFAGQMLAETLIKASQKPKEEYYGMPNPRPLLYAMMTIYRDAGRAGDALYLLENARGWGAGELTPITDYRGEQQWGGDSHDIDLKARAPLGELAAWALARSNRRAQAAQVARATLERVPGNDGVYALLVDLEGQKALPFLKQLRARDIYEERPLIWQAELARRAGDLTLAAQLAAQAIAVDPSDGEQPRGDRLRAYDVLARVKSGQGETAKADELGEAVKAIRLSETADKWRVAGVAPRAIALYRRSLGLFDDAYCVQSRLAVELTSQGEFEAAAGHFERAYQLMPVSFGRMESHCFGCEGVFGNGKSEPIARRVFRQLEAAQPNNPKIQYLAGYWRLSAGQQQAATRYFQRAVALDPLYLSAWHKLNGQRAYLSPMQQDAATLAVLRLDPASQHDEYGGGASFEVKRDYRGLWNVTKEVLPRINPALKANFPLPNSSDGGESYNVWELVTSPANAIARQRFVNFVSNVAR